MLHQSKINAALRAILPALLVCVSLLLSCTKDDTIIYGASSIGNVVDGVFTADNGLRYIVQEQTCEGDLKTLSRAFITMDVLSKAEGKDTYNIRLLSMSGVLLKDIVVLSEASPDYVEEMGSDPSLVQSIWTSGNYLNVIFTVPFFKDSDVAHRINLVYEGDEKDGKMIFSLRHNAYGEVPSEQNPLNVKAFFGTGIVSFPLTLLKEKGGKEVEIEVRTRWYVKEGDTYIYDTEPSTVAGTVSLQ